MVTVAQFPARYASNLSTVKPHSQSSLHSYPYHHHQQQQSHQYHQSAGSKAAARTMNVAVTSRELPMPNVTRLNSLAQAHATLLHCWTKLSRFIQENQSSTASASSSRTANNASPSPNQRRTAAEERQIYQRWLNQWETAFTAFLSSAVASMNSEDITQSRILKANHLACTVLTADGTSNFETEFQAIVDLAGAVLQTRNPSGASSGGSPRSTASTGSADSSGSSLRGLDVREPLVVLLQRCRRESTCARARDLLRRIHQAEGV